MLLVWWKVCRVAFRLVAFESRSALNACKKERGGKRARSVVSVGHASGRRRRSVRLRSLVALTEFSLSAASRWFSFGIIPRTMRTDKSPARLQLILTVTWQRKDSIRTRRSANAHRVYATSMMPTSADSRPGLDDGHGRRPGAFARPRVRRERGCKRQQRPRTFDGRR